MQQVYYTTGGILCSNCNQIIAPDRYDEHANSHIHPKFLTPSTLANRVNKLATPKLYLDQSTDNSDLAVRSIHADDIPQPESQRKVVVAPRISHDGSRVGEYRLDKTQNRADVNQLTSNLGAAYLDKDEISMMNIVKKVDLNPKLLAVGKKEIHFYKNSNFTNEVMDNGGSARKTNQLSHLKDQGGYQMNETSSDFYEMIPQPAQKQKLKDTAKLPKTAVTIGKQKKAPAPPSYKAIDTHTNPDMPFSSSHIDIEERPQKQPKIRDRGMDRNEPVQRYHDFQCHDCHGFYCKTCGSDIPAQYRPFWTDEVDPYYVAKHKELNQERIKNRTMKNNCQHCRQHKNEKMEDTRQ